MLKERLKGVDDMREDSLLKLSKEELTKNLMNCIQMMQEVLRSNI